MSGQLRVVRLGGTLGRQWDAFVRSHPRGTAYHLSAWAEVLRSAYAFQPAYLALERASGELSGVLPLVRGNGLVSHPRLVSLPVVRWGGPLADSIADEASLLQAACRIASEEGTDHVGVRSERRGYEDLVPELRMRPALPTWRITLPAGWDAYREQLARHSKSHSRSLKKAESSGLRVREARSERDLRRFYHLYLRVMRANRSLPRRYRELTVARRLLEPFGVLKLLVAEHDGRQVAGGIFQFFGERVENVYQASDDRYLDLRPNHALYGGAIQRAIESGHRYFDFGAGQPGTSLAMFKSRWSAEPVERFHYSFDAQPKGRSRVERSMRATMRGGQTGDSLRARAWEMMPLPLTRLAGALVYRYL
jgi:hypothetical protein